MCIARVDSDSVKLMTLPNAIVDPAKLPWSDTDFFALLFRCQFRRSADLVLSSRKASMRSIRCEIAHHLKNVIVISGKPNCPPVSTSCP
jgi:hypothetical protein